MDPSVAFPLPMTASSAPEHTDRPGSLNPTDPGYQVWGKFDIFFSKNEKTIEKCMKASITSGDKMSTIEHHIDSFSETAKVVLDGLAELGKIHPVIGVAVVAFHAIITLDLTRRDNDRKVIAIMLEMQNMMCAMFQLRNLKHAHVQESERDQERSRLHMLIENIRNDIMDCGNDIDHYLGQKTAFKLLKSKKFESRFKAHVEIFVTRRSELQTAITAYIAGGIDQANATIAEVSTKMDAMDSKVDDRMHVMESKLDDIFHALFRKLDTPQEKEALRLIDNNTVESCISKDDLLDRLLSITGEVISERDTTGGSYGRIQKSRKIIMDEMQQNFEESLKQNYIRFERLLNIQNNHVLAQLEKQEGYQKMTLSEIDKILYYIRPDTKLGDPEVKRIWERMGLKTSVKAKHFVLTFRDHYQHDHTAPPTPNTLSNVSVDGGGPQALSITTNLDQRKPHSPKEDPDAWLLDYIDAAHLRPIVEAMDADGSGFISVKEISAFAQARPKEWSLLEWMVYWAAGWHINLTTYRNKIYDILVQMHEALPVLHPANRVHVDEYLNGGCMAVIEGILRSTKSLPDSQNSRITELARFYGDMQENALRTNLKEVSYLISSAAEARVLVADPSRTESWIYPLLYLLLERHLEVIKLGRTLVLNVLEINTHWQSLISVLEVFEQRRDALAAIFSQIYQNVPGRFETFAYGMFHASYKENDEISPAKNSLTKIRAKPSKREIILNMRHKSDETSPKPDLSILALGKGDPLEFEDMNIFDIAKIDPDRLSHPLEGYWSATCFDEDGYFISSLGLIHFVLSIAPDGSITGSGEAYGGKLALTGMSMRPDEGTSYSLELKIHAAWYDYTFQGTHNPRRDTVEGSWKRVSQPQNNLSDDHPLDAPPADASVHNADVCAAPAPAQKNVELLDSTSGEPVSSVEGVGHVEEDESQPKPRESNIAPYEEIKASDESSTHPSGASSNQNQENSNQVEEKYTPNMPCSEDGPEKRTSEDSVDANAALAMSDPIGHPSVINTAEGSANHGTDGHAPYADVPGETAEPAAVPTPMNSFLMRRTPADIRRFRRGLDLDTEGLDSSLMARNRWKFALKVTKFQIQRDNMSWEYIRARFGERRLWLDLTAAFWERVLSLDGQAKASDLTGEFSPSQARLYEEVAHFLGNHVYAGKSGRSYCDYCRANIMCERFRCITCTTEDFSNQVDLCVGKPDCIENASSNAELDFVHTPSHTLVRQKYMIQQVDLAATIKECRMRSENVKKRYRALDQKKKLAKRKTHSAKMSKDGKSSAPVGEAADEQPLVCVCCEKEVSLPCWVCVTCDADTAVCLDCELNRAKIVKFQDTANMHWHDHLLLRIHDSSEVHSREVNNVRLQKELINITADLRSLEQKVTTHLRSASKVHTFLRRFTIDGDVKLNLGVPASIGDSANARGSADAAVTGAERAVDGEEAEDDSDDSDIFGSISSSDTDLESPTLDAAPNPTPRFEPATPAAGAEGSSGSANSALPSTVTPVPRAAAAPEVKMEVVAALADGVLDSEDTPRPTSAQFFESLTCEPTPNDDVPPPQISNGDDDTALPVEATTSTAEPLASARISNSRQLGSYILSIDSRVSSLDTRVSSLDSRISSVDTRMSSLDSSISSLNTRILSLDTRISSLDTRLNGMESTLGDILELLRQSRS